MKKKSDTAYLSPDIIALDVPPMVICASFEQGDHEGIDYEEW